jgi:ABC-type amino acid transport substrate-binding protein
MAGYLSSLLGIPRVEYVYVDWQALIPALQANKCDLIWNGLVIRSDRAKAPGVRFTTPYFLGFDELSTRKDSPIQSLEDLRGRRSAA